MSKSLLDFVARVWAHVWISHPSLVDVNRRLRWEVAGAGLFTLAASHNVSEYSVVDEINRALRDVLEEPWSAVYQRNPATCILKQPFSNAEYFSLLQWDYTSPVSAAIDFRKKLALFGADTEVVLDFRYQTQPNSAEGLAALLPLIPNREVILNSTTRLQRGFAGSVPFYYSDDCVSRPLTTSFSLSAEGGLSVPPFYLSSDDARAIGSCALKARIFLLCTPLSANYFRSELAAIAAAGDVEVMIDSTPGLSTTNVDWCEKCGDWGFATTACVLSADKRTEGELFRRLRGSDQATAQQSSVEVCAHWAIALEKIRVVVEEFGMPYQRHISDLLPVFQEARHQIMKCKSAVDAEKVLISALVPLGDSHVFRERAEIGKARRVANLPAFLIGIADQCVVHSTCVEAGGLQRGDVVRAISRRAIGELVDLYARGWPHSSQQSICLRALSYQGILTGIEGTAPIEIEVERSGKLVSCMVPLTSSSIPPPARETKAQWDFGDTLYVDLCRETSPNYTFLSSKECTKLIVDLRGTISGAQPFDLIPYILQRPVLYPTVEFISRIPGRHYGASQWRVSSAVVRELGEITYPHPSNNAPDLVIILIDANAISWLETFLLLAKQSPNVRLYGTPTSGANGNVTDILLPDGSKLYVGCMRVVNENGEDAQGTGVLPDREVQYTVQDLREGKDTILRAAAMECGIDLSKSVV